MDLHQLLSDRRQELLERWAGAVQVSVTTSLSRMELIDRMPLFIDELVCALAPEVVPLPDGGSVNAEEHGLQRLRLGFDIGEVVREYGLLHVAILQLADEAHLTLSANEMRVLATCLSKGTSDAVTQYQWERDVELQRQSSEHLGFMAHELRNPLASAQMAYHILRRSADSSSAADALGRSLARLSGMIDNALSHASLKLGAPLRGERVDLRLLLTELEREVAVEAEANGISLSLVVEPIVMQGDPRLLASAASNLVRNAIKFSQRGGSVVVRGWRYEERILISVEDTCGGLPPGKTEELFSPFVQKGADKSGFGLGLAIARQAAESHHGTVRVRNVPGHGCVFTIDLPAT